MYHKCVKKYKEMKQNDLVKVLSISKDNVSFSFNNKQYSLKKNEYFKHFRQNSYFSQKELLNKINKEFLITVFNNLKKSDLTVVRHYTLYNKFYYSNIQMNDSNIKSIFVNNQYSDYNLKNIELLESLFHEKITNSKKFSKNLRKLITDLTNENYFKILSLIGQVKIKYIEGSSGSFDFTGNQLILLQKIQNPNLDKRRLKEINNKIKDHFSAIKKLREEKERILNKDK